MNQTIEKKLKLFWIYLQFIEILLAEAKDDLGFSLGMG